MTNFTAESRIMRFLKKIGMESIAWSLRRLYVPVHKDALVLEVGSGGNPYCRANVLLDAYESTHERHWAPLVADRPTVLGFVECLPFRDGAFDFVIASHVLEHSSNPEQFLNELQRVARAGYIEVPDAFLERVNPYKDHRLEITLRENKLIIRKKPSWMIEPDTVELYENKVKSFLTTELIPKHPFAFHVRYYWENSIDFTVVNQEVNADWAVDRDGSQAVPAVQNIQVRMRSLFLAFLRSWLSQISRNKKIDLLRLLICPSCGSDTLSSMSDSFLCGKCGIRYPIRRGIPVMIPGSLSKCVSQ